MSLSPSNQVGGALPGLTLKAWAQVATDGTLVRGFNVSSITKGSTGSYTVNFSTAMLTTTYHVRPTLITQSTSNVDRYLVNVGVNTVNACTVNTYDGASLANRQFFVEFYE